MPDKLPDGLTYAHMVVLACFAREPFAAAPDIAAVLGVPVAVAAMLVADLPAAGMIEPARYVGLVTSAPFPDRGGGRRERGFGRYGWAHRREDPQTGHAPRSRSISLPAFRNERFSLLCPCGGADDLLE